MKGSGPQTVSAWQGENSRRLNNVRVSGAGSVDFNYGMKAIGTFQITSSTVVTTNPGYPLHITGAVNVATGATLTIPNGSTFSSQMTTYGLLRFSGSSVSTSSLFILSGGVARALSISPTVYVDFNAIYVDGGTRDDGTGGGFRPPLPPPGSPIGLTDLSLSGRR